MFEENILKAAKFSINMIQKISTSKVIRETSQSVKECVKSIQVVNDKLDMMLKSTGDIVLGKLKSANLSLEDFSNSDGFTDSNIQILKELYISNIGLPLDENTGVYSNNEIVAYSYLGLILLENNTEQNHILIFRYIIRMFYAESIIAKRYFPEVYNSFFEEYVLMYEGMEYEFLCKNKFDWHAFKDTYKDIGELIEFYEISIEVDDWTKGAETFKEKLFGKFLNKAIGSISISPSNCNQLFNRICNFCNGRNNYSLKAVSHIITDLVCTRIINKFKMQYYVEKRQVKITRLLSEDYLKYITSRVD